MPTVAFRFSTALIALAFCSAALAQESFSTLEERMTGQEFMETGLHKLSREELAALNQWIRERSLTQEEAIELNRQRAQQGGGMTADQDMRGFEDRGSSNAPPINSRLVGNFNGWRGDTRFELENGMVWEQSAPDTYYVSEVESPRVTIKQGMFGGWRLQVEGYNKQVQVDRVE
ncbi:MAG: hypothetical protein V2J19_05735 [Wenzhouxiangella sp.]|jgi:hypothetical protein|nr:hypothetical protein [Wenzhouxiangella sp.]